MILTSLSARGAAVTFTLATARRASVVGDFNDWDPTVHPMKAIDDIVTVTVELQPGRYAFRYLAEGGDFFDDLDAHYLESNGCGGTHSVLVVESTQVIDHAAGPDNIVQIVGIGPKIAAALVAGGITTFADLATISVTDIKAILGEAGIRLAPGIDTWSAQAGELAKGTRKTPVSQQRR